jgi:hypothetical protein
MPPIDVVETKSKGLASKAQEKQDTDEAPARSQTTSQ